MIRFAATGWAWWATLGLSLLFCWPALANASAVNSDPAIVGLQAIHILRGEWTPFLFGSDYQSSADAFLAAAFFAVFGPAPLTLMASALFGHVIVVRLVWVMLARHLRVFEAMLVTSLLVFTTNVVQTYALTPPRQTALTLAMFAAWLLMAEHRITRPLLRFGAAGLVGSLAAVADPYALVFQVPLLVLVVATLHADRRGIGGRSMAYAVGTIAGLLPLVALWASTHGPPRAVIPSIVSVGTRAKLLATTCLPIALGMRGLTSTQTPSPALAVVHAAAALSTVVGFAVAIAAVAVRSVPAPLKRLALFGLAATSTTALAFLFAPCAVDVFSSRYLVGFSLGLPFLFASSAHVSRRGWGVALVVPLVLACGVEGWRSYGMRTRGLSVTDFAAGLERDDYAVERIMRTRGVNAAISSYWSAYRLTFLFGERIIVAPREKRLDRYAPYRAQVLAQEKIAYLVENGFAWEAGALKDERIREFGVPIERVDAGRYTIVFLSRRDVADAPPLRASLNSSPAARPSYVQPPWHEAP